MNIPIDEHSLYCPFSIFKRPNGWLVECYYDGSNRWTSYESDKLDFAIESMIDEMTADFGQCSFELMVERVGKFKHDRQCYSGYTDADEMMIDVDRDRS